MQRFRGGLVFKAHRLCVTLNTRLERNKEEEKARPDRSSEKPPLFGATKLSFCTGKEGVLPGCGVWGVGFEVWGLGFGVCGLGFGVWGLGLRFRV